MTRFWKILRVVGGILALVGLGYLAYVNASDVVPKAFLMSALTSALWWVGIVLLSALVLVIIIRLIKGKNNHQNRRPPNPGPTPATAGPPAPPPSHAQRRPADWGWVSTVLKWLLILGVLVALWFLVVWLWDKSEPIRKSPAPALSHQMRTQQRSVSVITTTVQERASVPAAGNLPVCAQNSAKIYTLNENDWTRIDLPAGCQPVIDPDYRLGVYLVQYLDRESDEWLPASSDSKAIRLRKQVSPEPCTITVQVWFRPPAA